MKLDISSQSRITNTSDKFLLVGNASQVIASYETKEEAHADFDTQVPCIDESPWGSLRILSPGEEWVGNYTQNRPFTKEETAAQSEAMKALPWMQAPTSHIEKLNELLDACQVFCHSVPGLAEEPVEEDRERLLSIIAEVYLKLAQALGQYTDVASRDYEGTLEKLAIKRRHLSDDDFKFLGHKDDVLSTHLTILAQPHQGFGRVQSYAIPYLGVLLEESAHTPAPAPSGPHERFPLRQLS